MTDTSFAGHAGPLSRTSVAAPAWARWIGSAAGLLLGVVLLYSAWGKALDPHGVGEIYARRGMLPDGLAGAAVMLVVAIEAGLAGAFFAGVRRPPVLALATLMMGGFFGLTFWDYLYPPAEPSACGCFGNLIERSPAQAAVQDGVFFALALLAWLGRPSAVAARRWLAPVGLFALALGFAAIAPRLPLDGLATRLAPGADMARLKLDEIVPEAQRGKALVVILDRTDEATRAEVPRLNEQLVLKGGPVQVFALAEPNPEAAQAFTWEAGPAFEVRELPFAALKPLYRTLPRSFLVEDNRVLRTWNGIPDDATLAALAEGRTP